MSKNRAPKGVPTGGEFVASTRAEPTMKLPGFYDIPAQARRIGFSGGGRQIMNWDTDTPIDYDSLTEEERVKVRKTAKEHGFPDPRRAGLRFRAEKAGDRISERVEEINETVDALGEAAGHVIDIHRGDTPIPEVEGDFVGWNQMLPKFLRRKNKETAAPVPGDQPAPGSDDKEQKRLARQQAVIDLRNEVASAAKRLNTPQPQRRNTTPWR